MSDSIVIEESNGEIIVIEPTVVINQSAGVDQIPADWNQKDNTKPDFIKNKPTIPGAPAWGEIGGDIADQSDLVAEFEKKQTKGESISLESTSSVIFDGDTELFQSVDGEFYISGSKVIFTGEVEAPDTGIFSRKVDKVPGKGLSTNDYTDTDKAKLGSAVTSSTIAEIVTLTQTAYDALNPKVATTLYIITGA